MSTSPDDPKTSVVVEVAIGIALLVAGRLWWAAIGLMLHLAPLLLANLVAQLADGIHATVAMGIGVAAAYAIGLTPFDGESRLSLGLAVAGSLASVAVWQAIRASADVWTVLVTVTVAGAGWVVRRAIDRGQRRSDRSLRS